MLQAVNHVRTMTKESEKFKAYYIYIYIKKNAYEINYKLRQKKSRKILKTQQSFDIVDMAQENILNASKKMVK